MEMRGGTVAVHIAGLGTGSKLVVRLPLMAAERQQTLGNRNGGLQQECSRPSGHRLLVVDDNPDAAVSLAMLLTLQGHEFRLELGMVRVPSQARVATPPPFKPMLQEASRSVKKRQEASRSVKKRSRGYRH